MKQLATIWVTFSAIGFHCYPMAPADVAYLRARHRHEFQFKVQIEVYHDERELEFHQFQRFCKGLFPDEASCSDKSCETMARELGAAIQAQYGTARMLMVEVSEDGECGSALYWE